MFFTNVDEKHWIVLNNGTKIHKTAIIYPDVDFGYNCIIGEYVVIGRNNLEINFHNLYENQKQSTKIGNGVVIDAYTYISQGAQIGNNVILGRNTFIGRYTQIRDNTKCHYNAQIFENVYIGENCRIGGLCCNAAKVGNDSNIYGVLGHKFKMRNDVNKKAPIIGNNVTVGIGSVVLEAVVIEDDAYIAANAIVTQNVKSGQKIRNVNEIF